MNNPLIELARVYAEMSNGGARLNVAQCLVESDPAYGKIKVSDGWIVKATFDTSKQAHAALVEAGFEKRAADWKLKV